MQIRRSVLLIFTACVLAAPAMIAQSTAAEARTEHAFAAAKKAGAPELYAFLKTFPKGADLHMHLSGAIYAETFLAEAARENLCVDPVAMKLAPAPCKAPDITAAAALADQTLYDKLIDAFSMRSFVPYSAWSGHDQFFATFSRWGALEKSTAGDWLNESSHACRRAERTVSRDHADAHVFACCETRLSDRLACGLHHIGHI